MKKVHCPIFKATGKRKRQKDNECQICPFNANCPEDKLNDVITEIIKDIGAYTREQIRKVNPHRVE